MNSGAVLPDAFCYFTVRFRVFASTVHFAIFPLTSVRTTISPHKRSLALTLVIDVIALIVTAISPAVNPITVHIVFLPFASVLATVLPLVSAFAIHAVISPLTLIQNALEPFERPVAMLLTLVENPNKLGTIWERLCSFAFVKIVLPLTNVRLCLSHETPEPIAFVIFELTFVGVPVLQP